MTKQPQVVRPFFEFSELSSPPLHGVKGFARSSVQWTVVEQNGGAFPPLEGKPEGVWLIKPKDYPTITEGLPKDKTTKTPIARLYYIYT